VPDCHENGNEPACFMKSGEFFNHLSDSQLLMKDCMELIRELKFL
jgi:hypothetical protein